MNLEKSKIQFDKLENDSAIQNLMAQADSRYILYAANEPLENFPNYTLDLDEKCLHIAFSYLGIGWTFFENGQIGDAIVCIEKAAEILEHLYAYANCDKVFKEFYCITCALAYYVASQYSKSFIVLQYYGNSSEIAQLMKTFLSRNFIRLEELIKDIEFQSEEDDYRDQIVYTKILSKAISFMMRFVIDGNRVGLESGKEVLLDLIELAELNDEAYMWWIFRLLYLIFEEFETASLWSVLPPVIDNEENCNRYIRTNIFNYRSVVELFKSQRECISTNFLSGDGVAIGMPTSSGKTKIAEIAIIKTLSEFPDSLCIFIAPFRSLANEVENNLSKVLSSMGYVLARLYGGTQATQQDKKMISESNVVVATPEKVKSILRSSPEFEERIKLVIVDEGHLVGAQARYLTSELLIEEIKISLRKNAGKLILLSAVLPNLSDFANWVSGDEKKYSKSTWRPSAQRFGQLIFSKNSVSLEWMGIEPRSFNNGFVEKKLVKPERVASTGRVYKSVYFPNDKKEAVGATAVKMHSMGSVLIYVGKSTMVMSQGRVLSSLFMEQGITHQWENTDDLKYVKLTCEEAYGENSEIYNFILQGIVCHSSKLMKEVRQSIEQLMANGNPKIIVATSTLGQGVNIGVSTVIISNVYFDEENMVDVKDFWNIAGRAGRAFADTEGKILFAIDRTKTHYSIGKQIDNMHRYFEKSNIEEAKSGLLRLLEILYKISKECDIDYETFLELLAENRETTDAENVEKFFVKSSRFLDMLDDTLISMDIKNDVQNLQQASDWIDEVFQGSLAYIQAKTESIISQGNVLDILKSRNIGAIKLAGAIEKWQSVACSSVSLKTSLYIDQHIDEVVKNVAKYIESSKSFSDLLALISYLDRFIENIPITAEEKLIVKANGLPIREKWFSGASFSEINKIDREASEVCNKYYGFHFPWIVNAVSKKLKLLGNIDESQTLEDLSLISEIGLPDLESAKVYISGIKSRESAIELSGLINFNSMISVTKQLVEIYDKVCEGRQSCSQKARDWLSLLKLQTQRYSIQELENIRLSIRDEYTKNCDRLFVKKYQGRIYLCTPDYSTKLRVKEDNQDKYEELVGIRGTYFEKNSKNIWQLKSLNPFVKVLDGRD